MGASSSGDRGNLPVSTTGLAHTGISETLTIEKHHFLRVLERMQRQNEGAPRSDVLSIALTVFLGDIFIAAATDFRDVAGFSRSFWQAAAWIVALSALTIAIVWTIRLVRWHRGHPRKQPEDIYEEVVKEMENDRKRLAQIDANAKTT